MVSRSDRMALLGSLVMGALVAVAIGVHYDSDIPSLTDPAEHDASSADERPLNAASAKRQVSTDGTSDADVAYILQSVRDALQRNDLTSARVLLNAVFAVRKDLPEALELKKELDVREARQSSKLAVVSKGDPPVLNHAAQEAPPAAVPAVRVAGTGTARTTPHHQTRKHASKDAPKGVSKSTSKAAARKVERKTPTTTRTGAKTSQVDSTTIVSREIPADEPKHKRKESASSKSSNSNPSFRGSK